MKINLPQFQTSRPLAKKIELDLETGNGTLHLDAEPLPIGFWEAIEKEIPSPKPPRIGFVRNRKGKLERDDFGQPISEYDTEDKGYLEAKRTSERRQNTLLLWTLFSSCEVIEFETKREACKDAAAFADAIYNELLAAGMTTGQQTAILRIVHKACGLNQDEIEESKKN